MECPYCKAENRDGVRRYCLNCGKPLNTPVGGSSARFLILDCLSQQTPPIVHRDINPANIVISAKDKKAHLVDFGIARDPHGDPIDKAIVILYVDPDGHIKMEPTRPGRFLPGS
jgi:serine/threonine protein kinase